MRRLKLKSLALLAATAITLSACGGNEQNQVAEINNDWTGNEIKIDSLPDEKVKGVHCYMAHFDRSVIDRLRKGSWFENPSNGTIHCDITGPIVVGDIEMSKKGEEVFVQSQSLIFKKLAVRRIYDAEGDALLYLVYSRQIIDGSAKMAIASVGLYGQNVTWAATGTSSPTMTTQPQPVQTEPQQPAEIPQQ